MGVMVLDLWFRVRGLEFKGGIDWLGLAAGRKVFSDYCFHAGPLPVTQKTKE